MMTRHPARIILCPLGLSIGIAIGACEKENDLADVCRKANAVIYCEGDRDENLEEKHVDDCIARHEESEKISKKCQNAYLAVLECIPTLDCYGNAKVWRTDECGTVLMDSCGPEGAVLCEECPGFWFAAE